MASKLSTPLSPYSSSSGDTKLYKHLPFTTPIQLPTNHRFKIHCNVSNSSPKSPSLADQLKPLSTTVLSDNRTDSHHQLQSKPKSTWVNPAKTKPSVLSLQRHKRSSSYAYNPQLKDLRQFARKLDQCEESEFLSVLEQIPTTPNRENALLILNSIRSWQKTLLYFDWVKNQDSFPVETIFYNVAMKSLRLARRFDEVEKLANDMVDNEIELDNITYSTIITCAKRCNMFDKAVEWFERMYKTGLMPDEVTYSAVLDVYAKLGKVEEVMSLYERGRASGWKPDPIAFAVLGKMFGEKGDYDGIRYVLQEMKSLEVEPNLVVYNTLLEAMGKAGKPGLARSLFEEMVESGIVPNEKTLTALIKIYGRARWGKDALELWERMKLKGWPMDFILYNTLLSMCADLGLVSEGEKLFEEMKNGLGKRKKPDSWSYTAMLNIYGSSGDADKAMGLFKEMSESGVEINVMGCTCLIQCLGRAKKIDDLVHVFEFSLKAGVRPDDRLCGCLLSVVSYCGGGDAEKVLSCLNQANPKLVSFIESLLSDIIFENLKLEFKDVLSNTDLDARRPFCNCLIDVCRNRGLTERAHELLYMGSVYGLYPGLHTKTEQEWRLNVRSLSVGAAHTAFEEWMATLVKIVEREETLPALFCANTGAGTHKFSQGLGSAFGLQVEKVGAPFRESEEKAGFFLASREELVAWVKEKAGKVVMAV